MNLDLEDLQCFISVEKVKKGKKECKKNGRKEGEKDDREKVEGKEGGRQEGRDRKRERNREWFLTDRKEIQVNQIRKLI